MPERDDVYAKPLTQREWDALLDLFSVDDMAEVQRGFHSTVEGFQRDGAPVEVPTPDDDDDPPVPVRLIYRRSTWFELLDAWWHYLDHDCPHGWEVLEAQLGRVFDSVTEWFIEQGVMVAAEEEEADEDE